MSIQFHSLSGEKSGLAGAGQCISPLDRNSQYKQWGCRGSELLTEIEVGCLELLEGVLKRLIWLAVVGVVQLGGEEDFLARNTRVLDALADLALVAVRSGGIDVPVTGLECDLDSLLDETGLRLPGS